MCTNIFVTVLLAVTAAAAAITIVVVVVFWIYNLIKSQSMFERREKSSAAHIAYLKQRKS